MKNTQEEWDLFVQDLREQIKENQTERERSWFSVMGWPGARSRPHKEIQRW